MKRSITIAVITLAVLGVQASPSLAIGHLMTLADLRHEVGISEPRFTPDGRGIVFVKTTYDYDSNDVNTDLDEIDISTRAIHTITSTMSGLSSPRFSSDGTRIAFLADGISGVGSDASQIFVMPAGGGTPKQITHASEGVDSYAWRPDGSAFAYVTADKPKNPIAFVVGDNDYLATSAPEPWHLWTIGAGGGTSHRLTSGSKGLPPGEVILPQAVPEAWFSWSEDGKTIAYTQMPNPYKTDGVATRIMLIDVATGHQHPLTTHAGEEAGGEFSPDGSRIMYWYPRNGDAVAFNDLLITSASGGMGKDATYALDRNAIDARWMPDSRSLIVLAHDGTWARLWRVDEDGVSRMIDTGRVNPGAVPSGGATVDVRANGALTFPGSEPERPTELYYISSLDAAPKRLTDLNGSFAAMHLGRVTNVNWVGPDGYHEDGVLTYPADYVAGKKYPLVLQIHGGPNWASVEAFDTDYEGLSQLFAAHGYAVFEPNYRGSDELDNAYQVAIFNDAGDGPGKDVLAGIDAVEKLGLVDTSRIGVSGWSYGGYMTTWLIGHYHIWKAAVAGAAPTDDFVDYAISDYNVIGKYYFEGSPWTSKAIRDAYIEQSPITYADQVTTPILILHDTGDVRVPIVEDYEFFHALRDRHVPVEFVAYPVEGHYPSDPIRGEDIYRRWVGWFDKYLK